MAEKNNQPDKLPVWPAVIPASLRAVPVRAVPLLYAGGADAQTDRPRHVRAGSGLCWWHGQLAVVQDDALFLGLFSPPTSAVQAIALPAGKDGRRQFSSKLGNKADKPDFESVLVWPDGRLVALGSGSTPARQRWLVAHKGPDGQVQTRWLDAAVLYAALRALPQFAGAELNVEGAAIHGDYLWLLQRGNGAAGQSLAVVDALAKVPLTQLPLDGDVLRAPPAGFAVSVVAQLDLGRAPVRRTGTDLHLRHTAAGTEVWLAVAAENSPDTYQDGQVVWSGLARLVVGAEGPTWQLAPLVDIQGGLTCHKVEGLVADPDNAQRWWAVVDADDADKPCQLLELRVVGLSGEPVLV
jgi:hypothetical protein